MKLPLGALIAFLGYAVLWTGLMNIKVSYSVQGTSVVPSGKLWTLMDALTNGNAAMPPTVTQPPAPGGPIINPGQIINNIANGIQKSAQQLEQNVMKNRGLTMGGIQASQQLSQQAFGDLGNWMRSHLP